VKAAQISNPGGLYGQTASVEVDHIDAVNNSAGARTPGDVVVFATDATGVLATTTTTVNDKTVWGVVGARIPTDSINTQSGVTYAVGAVMPVIIRGPARINVGANTPAAGDLLTTAAVAGTANTNAGAPAANAVTGSLIGIVRAAAKDANNTLVAEIHKF
jgi:hypothetical protein